MSLPEPPATKASRLPKAAKSPKETADVTVLHRAKAGPAAARKAAPVNELLRRPAVEATELAREIEKGLAEGRLDILTPQALQALMAALCKTYAANMEAGLAFQLLADRGSVTSTDVMVACGALLKSADLQVFELGMWQSWTGR